jgi:hypothetical protein
MSQMIPEEIPQSIAIGEPGTLAGPEVDPAPGAGTDDPQQLVRQAKELLRRALDAEPDDEDSLLIEKMLTEAQQYLAGEQKLNDQAMGAGPGVKAVRKAQAKSPGGGY